jgi:hypothetical protein
MEAHYLSWYLIYASLDRRHTSTRGRTPLDNVPRLRNVVIGRHVHKTDGVIVILSSAFSPFDRIDHY